MQGSTGFRSRRLSRRLAATPQHIARSESKIYVAAVPLVGTERLQDLAKSLGQTLPPLLALHRVVLVQQPDEQARAIIHSINRAACVITLGFPRTATYLLICVA